jgi:hypothetical protein
MEGKPRGFKLEEKNPRRGMGPRSVHHIPNFTANDSEEHIYTQNDNDDLQTRQVDTPSPVQLTDLEAARVTSSMNGVIVKQTSVEVVETRKSLAGLAPDGRDLSDYYFLTHTRRDGDIPAATPARRVERKPKRSSVSFGLFGRS